MKSHLVACLLLMAILACNTFVSAQDDAGYCGSNCKARCAQAGMADRCLKYCGICCAKCKCVPAGTYGNKHQCPCYRDMVNSKGKPKCPYSISNPCFKMEYYFILEYGGHSNRTLFCSKSIEY